MSYTVKDILERLIDLESEMTVLYNNISNIKTDKSYEPFKIMAKVMAKEEGRHAIYFSNLKNNISEQDDIEIDVSTYDKVSQLMYEFKSKIYAPQIMHISELLKFVLNFEEENVALLIDIRGRLVKKDKDDTKHSYKVLSELIEEEKKHVENLSQYCK